MALGWLTEGIKVAPSGGTVLADTGLLGNNVYEIHVAVSAMVAARVDLELRDDTNTVTLKAMPIQVLAGTTQLISIPVLIAVEAGQRFRLATSGANLGTVTGAIFIA